MSGSMPRPAGNGPTVQGRRASFQRRTGAGLGNPAAAVDYDDKLSMRPGGACKTFGPSSSAR
jgi:hypothetical protein